MPELDAKQVVAKFSESRMSDLDTAAGFLREDAVWIVAGALTLSGCVRGREESFDRLLRVHTNDFQEITSEVTRMIAEDGAVGGAPCPRCHEQGPDVMCRFPSDIVCLFDLIVVPLQKGGLSGR